MNSTVMGKTCDRSKFHQLFRIADFGKHYPALEMAGSLCCGTIVPQKKAKQRGEGMILDIKLMKLVAVCIAILILFSILLDTVFSLIFPSLAL